MSFENFAKIKKKVGKTFFIYSFVLFIWIVWLVFTRAPFLEFLFLFSGSCAGYLLMEINWPFYTNKKVSDFLPLILLPLTIFILTSTSGIFEKALIIFLNLHLLVDKRKNSRNNQ